MGIKTRNVNGETVFDVYVTKRSPTQRHIRIQRLKRGIPTLKEAQKLEKQCLVECAAELVRMEKRGFTWQELVEKFEVAHIKGGFGIKDVQANTLRESIATLQRFTKEFWDRPCGEISPGDVKRVFRHSQFLF